MKLRTERSTTYDDVNQLISEEDINIDDLMISLLPTTISTFGSWMRWKPNNIHKNYRLEADEGSEPGNLLDDQAKVDDPVRHTCGKWVVPCLIGSRNRTLPGGLRRQIQNLPNNNAKSDSGNHRLIDSEESARG